MEGQSSTPLSELGRQQAQQLSQALIEKTIHDSNRAQTAQWPTHLYSSSLQRASATAQALSEGLQQAHHPLVCQYSSELQEIHQGIFQGLTWTEATEQFPELCAQLMRSLTWQPVPQAETLTAAQARAANWLNTLEDRHTADDILWVVSHAGIMQYMIAAILGCDRTWHIPIPNTAIFEFWRSTQPASTPTERYNPQQWLIKRFNDCRHLELKDLEHGPL